MKSDSTSPNHDQLRRLGGAKISSPAQARPFNNLSSDLIDTSSKSHNAPPRFSCATSSTTMVNESTSKSIQKDGSNGYTLRELRFNQYYFTDVNLKLHKAEVRQAFFISASTKDKSEKITIHYVNIIAARWNKISFTLDLVLNGSLNVFPISDMGRVVKDLEAEESRTVRMIFELPKNIRAENFLKHIEGLFNLFQKNCFPTYTNIDEKYGEFEKGLIRAGKIKASVSQLSQSECIAHANQTKATYFATRTITASTASPDHVFDDYSKPSKRNRTTSDLNPSTPVRKSPPSYLIAISDFDSQKSSPRRSARIKMKAPVAVSSEEFSYMDPEFDSEAEFLFSFPEGENDSVDISSYELARLAPGVWLNDNLIDFELKYILSNIDEQLKPRVHLFNSFFYHRLASGDLPSSEELESGISTRANNGYSCVRSWTRKTLLFEKDFVFIPICENLHWYLAVICYPRNMLVKKEEESDTDLTIEMSIFEKSEKRTTILIFDSLKVTVGKKLKNVLFRISDYLIQEARDKLNVPAYRESCSGFLVNAPRQHNFSDCGCFLLQYVEKFLSGPPVQTFYDILLSKKQTYGFVNWFEPSVAAGRRDLMRERIKNFAADYKARSLLRASHENIQIEDHSSDVEEIIMTQADCK